MTRMILTGTLALATGLTPLMAQQPKANAPTQQGQKPAGPAPKSQAEGQALQALMQLQGNPDAIVKAGDEFLTKYADTDFKEAVLLTMAKTNQQKGENDNAQNNSEKVVEVKSKSFQAQLMVGELLASH